MKRPRLKGSKLIYLLFGLFFFLFIGETFAQSESRWRIKNRLQASYETDSNIREQTTDSLRINTYSTKALLHSRANFRSKKIRANLSFQGGLQTYANNTFENKIINEITGGAGYGFKSIAIGLRSFARLKLYLNDDFDYGLYQAEPYLTFPIIGSLTSEISFKFSDLSYNTYAQFNYTSTDIRIALSKPVNANTNIKWQFEAARLSHNRNAYGQILNANNITELARKQKDLNYLTKVQLNYSKKILANLAYIFQYNNSNSYGYTYSRHQIILLVGIPIFHKTILSGYSALQIKNYRDTLDLPQQQDLDAERTDSNFFIIDVTRELNSQASLLIRFSKYNNESVIRNRFYNKNVLTIGIDYKF